MNITYRFLWHIYKINPPPKRRQEQVAVRFQVRRVVTERLWIWADKSFWSSANVPRESYRLASPSFSVQRRESRRLAANWGSRLIDKNSVSPCQHGQQTATQLANGEFACDRERRGQASKAIFLRFVTGLTLAKLDNVTRSG